MPLTSSVMGQRVSNFRLYRCAKKFQMLRKNVKSLLEQGVRCTLTVDTTSIAFPLITMGAKSAADLANECM